MKTFKPLCMDEKKVGSAVAYTSLGANNITDNKITFSLTKHPWVGTYGTPPMGRKISHVTKCTLIETQTTFKPDPQVKKYLSCNCDNNVECLIGMLGTYSRLEGRNWLKQYGNGFLSACSPNYFTQSYYWKKIKRKFKNINHVKNLLSVNSRIQPSYPLNRQVHIGKPANPKVYSRTGHYKDGIYKSILQANQYTGICPNYLIYAISNYEDSEFKDWYLIPKSTRLIGPMQSPLVLAANLAKSILFSENWSKDVLAQAKHKEQQLARKNRSKREFLLLSYFKKCTPCPYLDIHYGARSLRIYNAPTSIQPLYKGTRSNAKYKNEGIL